MFQNSSILNGKVYKLNLCNAINFIHVDNSKNIPMKAAQIFTLLILITSFSTFAQEDVPEGVLTISETMELIGGHIISFGSAPNNVLQVEQIGNNNELTAIQQLTQSGSYIFQTLQKGNDNVGYTYQSGVNHELILNQNGNNNNANLWSFGLSTQNFVYQQGSDNSVNSYIENTSMEVRTATLVQIGDFNSINLQLPDINPVSGLTGISILQTGAGNSADLYLDHSSASYLSVEQTGGAVVSIMHSDFNFPTK